MGILDELVVELGIDVKGEQNLRKLQSSITSVTAGFAGLAAGAFVAIGAIRSVLDAASETADASRFARSIDVAFGSLQRLEFAAADVGISAGTLRGALSGLQQTVLALGSGMGSDGALAAFAHLGIDIRNANGELKQADQILLEIADRVRSSSNPALARTLAEQLGLGTELNLLLRLGSDGINHLGDEASRLGLVLGTDAAKASERFDSRLARLKKTGTALLVDVGLPLVEWVTSLIEGFQRFQKSKEGRVAIDLMRSTVKGLLDVVKLFAEPFRLFMGLWERFGPVAVAALAPLWPLIRPILAIVNPFTKARFAVLGLLAALQDLRVFFSGSGKSFIGDVLRDLGIDEDVARGRAAGAIESFRSRFGNLSGVAAGAFSVLPGLPTLPQFSFAGAAAGAGWQGVSGGSVSNSVNANVYVNGADNPSATAERVRRAINNLARENFEGQPKGQKR